MKKLFKRELKETVIDDIITEAYLGNEVELNNEQARELANEVIKKENKWLMIGMGLGAATALLTVYALSDND